MYYYIVDSNKLTQKEFERVQSQLYSSISEYHISGEIVRVTGVRTIAQLVETAFFHQAKTIVAIGNDQTLNEVINIIAGRDVTVGYIPLAPTEMSSALGIPDIPQACKFLAVRRIQELDLGEINGPPRVDSSNVSETRVEAGKNFLSKLSFGRTMSQNRGFDFFGLRMANELSKQEPFEIQFKVDNQYQATHMIWSGLIINSSNNNSSKIGNPLDGKLDLLLLPKLNKSSLLMHRNKILSEDYEDLPNTSIIHFKQLEITTPAGLGLNIGNIELTQTPAKISIKPKALKIIVGKDRNF